MASHFFDSLSTTDLKKSVVLFAVGSGAAGMEECGLSAPAEAGERMGAFAAQCLFASTGCRIAFVPEIGRRISLLRENHLKFLLHQAYKEI